MGNYKLLALDMDGTVLNSNHQLPAENAQWIKRAIDAGVTVSFSTGRSYKEAYPFVEQLGLRSPLITVNGGEVWRTPEEIYQRHLMEPAVIEEMYQLALRYNVWCWGYTTERSILRRNWDPKLNIHDEQWLKFGYTVEDDELRHQLMQDLARIGKLEVTNSSPINMEINPIGISKASGLASVCEILGISMDEIVAVGDSINDLKAIQSAGLGCAMGNAQQSVKDAADVVVGTNDEHGVAQVIRDYILA